MASAPSPSSRPRQTWRDRSRPQETAPEVKLVQRWLASLILLGLVAALAWLIYTFFFQPQTHFACLPVTNYGKYRVPPVPFFENDTEFLREFDKRVEVLVTSGESETLDQLTDDLNEEFGLRANDTLVLYVCAHGVSLARDGKTTQGYLMCGDKVGDDKNGGDSLLEIGEFLNRVRNCKAAHKIILLDAGHITVAPQLGMLVNQFPKYLEEAVHALGQDDNGEKSLWVLSANSLHESSHVVHSKCQSAFNDFVIRGLKGEADVGPNDNDFVDLSELVAFVGEGVRDWVKSQYGGLEHQTPQILWSGGRITTGVIDNQMQPIIVSRATAPPAADADAPPKEDKPAASRSASVRPVRGPRSRWPSTMPLQLAVGQPAQAQAEPSPSQPAPAPPAPAQPADGASKPDAAAAAAPATGTPVTGTPVTGTPATAPPAAPETPQPTSEAKAADKSPAPAPPPDVPGPYSKIQDAWRERDEVLKSDLSKSWTPVDYAPHAWRILESSLLDFEIRYRNTLGAKRPVFRPDYSAGEFAAAGNRYAGSRQPAETTGVIYQALRARNRGIYRAVDLVAWHCRASFGRAQTLTQFKPIEDLLRQLRELEATLSTATIKPDDVDRDNLEQKLGGLADNINQSLDSIDESLVRSIDQRLQGSTKGPLPGDVARELEDLLSIPLADTARRMRLLNALVRVGAQRDGTSTSQSDRQPTADRHPNEVIRALQDTATSTAGSRSALARASEQALLEWHLIKLANMHQIVDKQKNLDELQPGSDSASLKELAKFGYELREIYRTLAKSIETDEASPWHADGELRLLPAYDKASYEEWLAVVRDAHWTLPEKRDFTLSGPTALTLDVSSDWFPFSIAVTAAGNFAGTVTVTADYDKNKIEIEAVEGAQSVPDGQTRSVKLDAEHPSAEIHYRARRWALDPGEATELTFRASSPELARTNPNLPIRIEVPAPDDIELVVVPAAGSDDPNGETTAKVNDALVSDVIPRNDADSSASPRRVRLSTFAGHRTAFDFKLRHQLSRDRKVQVALYAVRENDPLKLAELYHLAAKEPQEFVQALGRSQPPGKKVAEAKELILPKSTSQEVPIEWTAFPPPAPPPKDAPPAAAAAQPTPEPERASLAGGLICVVQEPGHDSAPWITWVEVAPYAPDQYVMPSVRDEGSGRIRVDLRLTASARPLDGGPITVELEDSPDIKLPIKPSAKLSADNEFRDWVEATATDNGDSKETIEVRLMVDKYPRAFIYRLTPLDRSSPVGKEKWERDRTSIEFIKPHKLDSFPQPNSMDKVPVQLRVNAPSNRFNRNRPFRDQVRDRIEVGIDDDEDSKLNPSTTLSFYSDRLSTLTLDSVGAGGRVAIDTKVDDLTFDLPCPVLNKHANLVALLKFDGQDEHRDSVECIFDHRKPELPVVPETAVMFIGEKKNLKVAATDGQQGSGIKEIHFAYNTVERDDAARKQNPPLTATNNQSEFEVPFSEAWDSPRKRQMIVWSVDKVGLESMVAQVVVDVRPKPAMAADKKPAAKFGTIRGTVTAGGRGVPRVTVGVAKGAGPTKTLERTTKTDSDGKFEMKNLPPGDYPLEAEGTVRNMIRKSEQPKTVTIPNPPEEKPVEVEIPL